MHNKKIEKSDIENLTKTILVGLPAVGKSTLSDEFCRIIEKHTGVKIVSVSSDLKFRAVRKDPNHHVIKKFMKEYKIPESDFHLLIKTNDFVKKYGEKIFRDLESAIIIDMLENGEFDGKIPNLGGKAMIHPKTAKAFKDKGYNVIYLKADVKTIANHITRDFEAMLDGATITRSPINIPIKEELRQKHPKLADKSPVSFFRERWGKIIDSPDVLKELTKTRIQRKKDEYRYVERIKTRDRKALEIITNRHVDADPMYKAVADKTVLLSGQLDNDVKLLLKEMGISDISVNVEEKDMYTNSIRSIISGINEVVPYTYDDERYVFREYFDPIIDKFLNESPTSDEPKLVHLLGIPGAGKSTFYQNNKEEFKDFIFVGFDHIMEQVPQYQKDREELGKLEAFNKWEIPARIAGYELLRRAIENKKNIFMDHGGTPMCHRELLQNIKKMGYKTTMYYIDCEPEVAIERISKRERPFPAERMPERIALIEKQKDVMPKIVDKFVKINNR